MKELSFPKKIESSNENLSPIMKFFNSIARRVDKDQAKVKKIDVSSVRINPYDAKVLKKEIKKWCKKVLRQCSNSCVDDIWLDVGPVEDGSVPKGKCLVNIKTLFNDDK